MGDPQDLMRRIASAGERVDPGLSDRDVERLVAGARRQRQRRGTTRAVLAAGAAVSLVLVGALVVHHGGHPRRLELAGTPPSGPALAERTLRLADGSTAVPLDPRDGDRAGRGAPRPRGAVAGAWAGAVRSHPAAEEDVPRARRRRDGHRGGHGVHRRTGCRSRRRRGSARHRSRRLGPPVPPW